MSPDEGTSRPSPPGGSAAGEAGLERLLTGSQVASALPGGTVTFAFTDIEGSTFLLRRLGEDRYGDLLARHRQIVRGAFYAADGVEIDRQGDASFFALPRARQAVQAAVEIQERHASSTWPDGVRVRVRIGLHTGEPSIGAEGYLGIDVVKGARICAVARGGQVLLSASTRALTASALPAGVTIAPLGERRLKDIDGPEPLFALVIADAEEAGAGSVLPEEWEREIQERFGTVGGTLARSIGGRIADSLQGVGDPRIAPPSWLGALNVTPLRSGRKPR